MTHEVNEDAWQRFIELCTQIKAATELAAFFDLFLTIEERETLSARFMILNALVEGKLTQRQMAEKFGVSISQITRGSNALKIIGPELRKFLEKSR